MIVIDEELLPPELNVTPDVAPSASLPSATVSVIESELEVAPPSVTLMRLLLAVEKVNDELAFRLAVAGAVTTGFTESATEFDPLSRSTVSVTEMASESLPLKPAVGV